MTKAILVIDIPKNCIICAFRYAFWNEEQGTFHKCTVCDEKLYEQDLGDNRADFCPLKPIPEKRENEEGFNDIDLEWSTDSYCAGWNDAIDEILEKNKK